jgi:hypothetical protein
MGPNPGVISAGGIHIANVNANELVFDGNISTGKITFNVETALDKRRHFYQILDHLNGSKATDSKLQQVHSVYIGDSLTDLLCLLRADVGENDFSSQKGFSFGAGECAWQPGTLRVCVHRLQLV